MQKFLIVGLGNIGEQYADTRHNIGFLVADRLAAKLEGNFTQNNFGATALCKYRARPLLILKPDTYMNLSGNAVKYWLQKESIQKENLLVITDDLHLQYGTLRMRAKGSDGGHNGLKSIQQQLGDTKYPRLRVGIGKDFGPGEQIDYVLGKWTAEEKVSLESLIDRCAEACLSFIFRGLATTMNDFNG